MTEKFDVIVIGAGPAGSAAAYSMAKDGLSVLVLERGEYPGSKNTSGAIFYGEVLSELFDNFWREAPIERWISNQTLTFFDQEASIGMKFSHEPLQKPIGLSLLRSKFDGWFAQKAADAGALVLTSTLVEDIIFKEEAVVGVRAAKKQGDVYADVVVVADGMNSLLAEKAKLRNRFRLRDMGLGIKELIKLPAHEIEQRFQLSGNEGAAYTFVGDGTQGLPGGCFLYTNKESLSVGLIVNLSSLMKAKIHPFTLLDHYKKHRAIAPMLAGGILKEYSAHLIPEGGYDSIPQLCADGILLVGDAAGLTVNSGLLLRGMDFAIASGIAAAEAVKNAKELGDYSARSLSYYQQLLEYSFVLRDLKKYRHLSRLLQAERIYKEYPTWFCQVAKNLFTVDTAPREKVIKILARERPRNLGRIRLMTDILKGIINL